MVEWGALLRRCARNRTEGSNPSLSAEHCVKSHRGSNFETLKRVSTQLRRCARNRTEGSNPSLSATKENTVRMCSVLFYFAREGSVLPRDSEPRNKF